MISMGSSPMQPQQTYSPQAYQRGTPEWLARQQQIAQADMPIQDATVSTGTMGAGFLPRLGLLGGSIMAGITSAVSQIEQGKPEQAIPQGILNTGQSVAIGGFLRALPINRITAYHGTPSGGFNEFDKLKKGITSGVSPDDVGFHFTDSKEFADLFSGRNVKLSAENIKLKTGQYPKGISVPKNPSVYEVDLDIKKPFEINQDVKINSNEIKKAMASGFDSIVKTYEKSPIPHKEYVVFDNKKIKIKGIL